MSAPARAPEDGAAALHQMLSTRALEPARTPEARERTIADLLALAGDRREPLEVARAEMLRRLARRTDDFEATHALRLIEGALVKATQPDGPWRWSRRVRRGRRRRP